MEHGWESDDIQGCQAESKPCPQFETEWHRYWVLYTAVCTISLMLYSYVITAIELNKKNMPREHQDKLREEHKARPEVTRKLII